VARGYGGLVLDNSNPLKNEIAEFQAAYERADYDRASRIFVDANKSMPEIAYRCFATYVSGQLASVLINSYRLESTALMLDKQHAKYPHMNILSKPDPAEAARINEMRMRNIDKGLPSIVLVSQGKSGSVTVANIFNSGFGLPSVSYALTHTRVVDSWARDFARGGACHTTHLEPNEQQMMRLRSGGIHRVIVHVRDPRQVLVSLVHHFEKYPEQLAVQREYSKEGNTIGAKAMLALPQYQSAIRWIERWINMEKHIAVHFSTFESMVSEWDRFVDRYINFYGGYSKYFSKKDAETRHDSLDYHFRSGRADEWREVFSVNGGAIPGQRGGVKAGHLREMGAT